jgi:hypothetical protein
MNPDLATPAEKFNPNLEAHSDVRELTALYALGALTQYEARSMEMHLQEGCAICQEELRNFEHAAATIGLACEEREPPEYLRDLLLSRIEREPQIPAPAEPGIKAEEDAPTKNPPIQPTSGGSSKAPWVVAVACALLALFGLYSWKAGLNTNIQLREQISAAQSETITLKKQLAAQMHNAEDPAQITEMAVRQEVRIARLKGQPATPGDSGTVFWDTQKNLCLVAAAFTPLAQGKNYQLWFSTPTSKILIGSLPADKRGRIYATLPAPPHIEGAMSAIVTLESGPASLSPAGPYCATGRID